MTSMPGPLALTITDTIVVLGKFWHCGFSEHPTSSSTLQLEAQEGGRRLKGITFDSSESVVSTASSGLADLCRSTSPTASSSTTATFPTTMLTKTLNTATVDTSIFATSNGYQGFAEGEGNGGSTSQSNGTNEATRHIVAVSMSFSWTIVSVLVIAATFSS
ncbi:hypothetical protein C8J56DRAFT_887030 [Mycena floridula]|nr:hypothetical protein C8J56DRAFT_887030 [Mycena floridula]